METIHRVYITEKETENTKMVLYSDVKKLKKDMVEVFNLGDLFEVQYELDLNNITVDEYIEILNLNPYVKKIETEEIFDDFEQFFEWIEANKILFLINDIFSK